LIDAKDEQASEWYKHYDAIPLPGSPLSLVLPYSTLTNILLPKPAIV